MPTVTVINQSRESIMLEDGSTLGAAGTPEARREGVTLSEGDRARLGERIFIIEPANKVGGDDGARSHDETKLEKRGGK